MGPAASAEESKPDMLPLAPAPVVCAGIVVGGVGLAAASVACPIPAWADGLGRVGCLPETARRVIGWRLVPATCRGAGAIGRRVVGRDGGSTDGLLGFVFAWLVRVGLMPVPRVRGGVASGLLLSGLLVGWLGVGGRSTVGPISGLIAGSGCGGVGLPCGGSCAKLRMGGSCAKLRTPAWRITESSCSAAIMRGRMNPLVNPRRAPRVWIMASAASAWGGSGCVGWPASPSMPVASLPGRLAVSGLTGGVPLPGLPIRSLISRMVW